MTISPPASHPVQPLRIDEQGTTRFKENKIVRYLFDVGPVSLNSLSKMPFEKEDYIQLMQLLGYSTVGFSELSYINNETYERIIAEATGTGSSLQAHISVTHKHPKPERECPDCGCVLINLSLCTPKERRLVHRIVLWRSRHDTLKEQLKDTQEHLKKIRQKAGLCPECGGNNVEIGDNIEGGPLIKRCENCNYSVKNNEK